MEKWGDQRQRSSKKMRVVNKNLPGPGGTGHPFAALTGYNANSVHRPTALQKPAKKADPQRFANQCWISVKHCFIIEKGILFYATFFVLIAQIFLVQLHQPSLRSIPTIRSILQKLKRFPQENFSWKKVYFSPQSPKHGDAGKSWTPSGPERRTAKPDASKTKRNGWREKRPPQNEPRGFTAGRR